MRKYYAIEDIELECYIEVGLNSHRMQDIIAVFLDYFLKDKECRKRYNIFLKHLKMMLLNVANPFKYVQTHPQLRMTFEEFVEHLRTLHPFTVRNHLKAFGFYIDSFDKKIELVEQEEEIEILGDYRMNIEDIKKYFDFD